MSGGGKGGKQTTTQSMPPFLEPYAKSNLDRAQQAQQIGYMPFYGPDIAAFNPTQQAAFASNIGAAEAFGMVPQGSLTAMQGMAPTPTTYSGGMQAYSSGDLFDQAVAELERRRPGQVAAYNRLFVDPMSGESSVPPTQVVSRTPVGTIVPVMGGYNPESALGTHSGNQPYGFRYIGNGMLVKESNERSPKGPSFDYIDGRWQLV